MLKGRQIEAFRAVMRHGGISRAAEVLGVTQPAVSRLIDSLARDVGFTLFEREGRGVVPTPEANLLMREVDVHFMGLDRVAAAAEAIRETRRGHLRIGVMPALAMSVAPRMVERIVQTYPEIQITLDVHGAPQLNDLVGSGELDLGFAHLDKPRADLEEVASWEVDCVCVVEPNHPLAAQAEVALCDLADTPLVLLSFGTSTAQRLERSFSAAGIVPQVAIQAQPSYAAYFLAAHGLGVGIIDRLTANALARQDVVVRPLKPRLAYEFKLIRPTGVRPSLLAAGAADIAAGAISACLIDKS
ncbi:MAG: LysR substrate-binding domain-containing protein [Pseudomonadota bacterium]